MNISERPHYEIASTDLAEWLERQGDSWWSVAGDWFLGGRIYMPCPGENLATELRFLDLPMLVEDRRRGPKGNGEKIGPDEVDALVQSSGAVDRYVLEEGEEKPVWFDNRILFICWKDRPAECVLEEDLETTLSERADAEQYAREQSSHGKSVDSPR